MVWGGVRWGGMEWNGAEWGGAGREGRVGMGREGRHWLVKRRLPCGALTISNHHSAQHERKRGCLVRCLLLLQPVALLRLLLPQVKQHLLCVSRCTPKCILRPQHACRPLCYERAGANLTLRCTTSSCCSLPFLAASPRERTPLNTSTPSTVRSSSPTCNRAGCCRG